MSKVQILKSALRELLEAIPPEMLRQHGIVGVDYFGHAVCGSEGYREYPRLIDRAIVAKDIVENI